MLTCYEILKRLLEAFYNNLNTFYSEF